jgi:hypothetical protein
MNTSVSLLAEIPETLHQSLRHYLDQHPTWDQDRVFTAALSFFLLNSESVEERDLAPHHVCAKVYLETLWG